MAERPRASHPVDDDPTTHFPAVDLQLDPISLHLQRLEAQTAVDIARHRNIDAREALAVAVACTTGDVGLARVAADHTSTTLRTAVGVLTALNATHGVDVSASIEVLVDVVESAAVVRVHGELDMFTSPGFEQSCLELLDGEPLTRLTVDLSAVTFLDSSGLAVLVEVRRVCVEVGTRFALSGVGERSRRLLAITRLDTVLDII